MEKIKFRGKRTDNGEWVEGSLRQEKGGTYILSDDYSIIFDEPEYHDQGMGCGIEDRGITDRYDACKYGWDEAIERYAEMFPGWVEVDPATVGQLRGGDYEGAELESEILDPVELAKIAMMQIRFKELEAENASLRTAQRWIPVSEGLPKQEDKVSDIYDAQTLAVIDAERHMVSGLVAVVVKGEDGKTFVCDDIW